jgi:hypothetical protein
MSGGKIYDLYSRGVRLESRLKPTVFVAVNLEFTQCPEANIGILPQIRQRSLHSALFPVHYSLL